jgi:hypothetical protein
MAFLNAGKRAGGNWRTPWIAGLIAASALVFANGALARDKVEPCASEIYDAIERDLRIEVFSERVQDEDSGFIVSQACKTWPYKPDLMLTALACDMGIKKPLPGCRPGDCDEFSEKVIVVAVIEKKDMRVVSRIQWKILEDAAVQIDERSLEFDTARYQLAQNTRAFGLRFHNSARGPSCRSGGIDDHLILLVPDGKSLRPVLGLFRYNGDLIQGDCATSYDAIWNGAELTIGVEKTYTNGFYDLRVTANITTFGEDEERTKPREHTMLRYNGKHYEPHGVVPWWLRSWGYLQPGG